MPALLWKPRALWAARRAAANEEPAAPRALCWVRAAIHALDDARFRWPRRLHGSPPPSRSEPEATPGADDPCDRIPANPSDIRAAEPADSPTARNPCCCAVPPRRHVAARRRAGAANAMSVSGGARRCASRFFDLRNYRLTGVAIGALWMPMPTQGWRTHAARASVSRSASRRSTVRWLYRGRRVTQFIQLAAPTVGIGPPG
jgi:hypothetical protein